MPDRSASELRAERQSLGDHNLAPQANQTLRFKLSGFLQAEEHIWWKTCVSSAPFFPWKSGVSTLRAYANQAQAARAEAWESMRRMQAGAAEDARGDEGASAACLQRMNASASAEAP